MLSKIPLLAIVFLSIGCSTEYDGDTHGRSGDEDKMRSHISQIFDVHDTDRSGALSPDEATGTHWIGKHFAVIDADSNGQATREEVMQFALDAHDGGYDEDACSEHEDLVDHVERGFAKLDANSDGVVTADELEGQPHAEMFAEADADSDGKVTLTELRDRAHKKDGGMGAPHGSHGHK